MKQALHVMPAVEATKRGLYIPPNRLGDEAMVKITVRIRPGLQARAWLLGQSKHYATESDVYRAALEIGLRKLAKKAKKRK